MQQRQLKIPVYLEYNLKPPPSRSDMSGIWSKYATVLLGHFLTTLHCKVPSLPLASGLSYVLLLPPRLIPPNPPPASSHSALKSPSNTTCSRTKLSLPPLFCFKALLCLHRTYYSCNQIMRFTVNSLMFLVSILVPWGHGMFMIVSPALRTVLDTW